MSSNLSALKGVYDAFRQGDMPAVLAAMDPDIDWREPPSLTYGNQKGPAAVAQNIFARIVQDISGFSVTPEQFVDGGDTVVTIGRYRGSGVKTGLPLDTSFVHVWRFRDGKLSFFETFTDTKQWLDVLGA